MKPATKGSISTSNLKKFKVWQYIGAPFWAPFSKFFVNPIRNTLNIMWDQKSNHLDKNSSFYPKMKCPNRYFQKSDRALEFSNLKMTIRSSEIHYLQIVFSKEAKKISKWAMTLIFFPVNADISYFSEIKKTELKTELRSVNFVLTETCTIQILLKFWRYFWLQSHRSSVLSSVLVWGNVHMSCLLAIKA